MQTVSGPEKKREEGHGKIPNFIQTDISKSEIYKDLKNRFITGKTPLQEKISIFDLPKIHSFTDNEKYHLLSVLFSSHDQKTDDIYFDRANNIITPSGINYINNLLNEAVEYYQNYLLRNIGSAFIQKWNKKKLSEHKISLKSVKDIFNFLDDTSSEKNSKADRQINCSLLKIALGLHEYKQNEQEFSQAEQKFKEIKDVFFFPYFYDEKGKEIEDDSYKKCYEQPGDCDYVRLQTKLINSGRDTIFFRSGWRIKNPQKIVLKMISNRQYNKVSAISDIYGIRNEVSSRKDALFLLEHIRVNIFQKQGTIVDKNIFVIDTKQSEKEKINTSIEFIKNHSNNLDPDFLDYILSYFEAEKIKIFKAEKSAKKISKSDKKYRDIKVKGKLGGKKIEVQINMVNSKNERGYAHHLIYDAKIKIQALVRLQSYISEPLIKRYIKEAVEKNIQEEKNIKKIPELLSLGGYEGEANKITTNDKNNVVQKIFDHLLEEENVFLKIDIPGKQHESIYTTIDHRNAYHHDNSFKEMYPDGTQIRFDGKWLNCKV